MVNTHVNFKTDAKVVIFYHLTKKVDFSGFLRINSLFMVYRIPWKQLEVIGKDWKSQSFELY